MEKIVLSVYIYDRFFTDEFIEFTKRFFYQHGLEQLFYTLRIKNGDASIKEDSKTGDFKFYTVGVTKLDPSKFDGKNAARNYDKSSSKKYKIKPINVDYKKDFSEDRDNNKK